MSNETILSLIISAIISTIISFLVSYFFWKRPISTDFTCQRQLKENEILYRVGHDHLGWRVEKIIVDQIESGKPFKGYATRKNNPGIKNKPKTLEEVTNLNFN